MGKPLYRYILDQVQPLSEDIFIITNNVSGYSAYEGWVLPDKIKGIGPLGGLHAALTYAQHDLCLVLACDMPFVSLELVHHMLQQAQSADAVVPQVDENKLEPFRAIYRKTCLGAIERSIRAGERRATSFLHLIDLKQVPRQELEEINASLDTFLNMNSPTDLSVIEAYARRMGQLGKGETD
jgi:molybdopterin-guanine dinucleotide biosynthesis protein A